MITWLWIIGLTGFFVLCVWLIIKVAIQLERQDARRGRPDLDDGGGGYIDMDGDGKSGR